MRHAFTLIEQLAALALASVLMLAAFGVLAGIARQRVAQAHPRNDAALENAAEQIQRDLLNARRLRIQTDQIILTGFCSLNPDTLASDHRPVRVIYRIERDSGSTRLIRRQESLDVLSNHNAWTELVCDNVDKLELVLLSQPLPPTTHPWADPFGPADGDEIVNAIRLVLGADDGKSVLNRVFCLR